LDILATAELTVVESSSSLMDLSMMASSTTIRQKHRQTQKDGTTQKTWNTWVLSKTTPSMEEGYKLEKTTALKDSITTVRGSMALSAGRQ